MLYYSKKLEENGKHSEAEEKLKMVLHNLEFMARGGIHDHVGGGFHRYSVDERWHGVLTTFTIKAFHLVHMPCLSWFHLFRMLIYIYSFCSSTF